jgi:hypothetical protein
VDGRNLCEELVKAGLAWHYKKILVRSKFI